MEDRFALIVDAELTAADGCAERATALEMPLPGCPRLPGDGRSLGTRATNAPAHHLVGAEAEASATSGTRSGSRGPKA
jgi:hypothetical protein